MLSTVLSRAQHWSEIQGQTQPLKSRSTHILQAGGYGKVITHVIIGLKSVKGTKQLKLDPTIYDSLQKEKVLPGDVIYIEANSGKYTMLLTVFNAAVCYYCAVR